MASLGQWGKGEEVAKTSTAALSLVRSKGTGMLIV